MKRLVFAANWKMNKNPQETKAFVDEFLPLVAQEKQNQVYLFAPSLNLTTLAATLKGSSIQWGAQNCYFEKQGAFTGETSPLALAQIGAKAVLIGHSERRAIFGEKNDLLAKKVKAVQQEGLLPLLCVGESLEEREKNLTNDVIGSQLREGLKFADFNAPVMIAYEPVWAIGTGKVATSQQAEEAHAHLRGVLSELMGQVRRVFILYGGSVNGQNARELSMMPNIDGFLVGGASLQPQSFASIINV